MALVRDRGGKGEGKEGRRTRVSPFPFVRLAGRPASSACCRSGRLPVRAALKKRVARSRASGGRSAGWVGGFDGSVGGSEGLEEVVGAVD